MARQKEQPPSILKVLELIGHKFGFYGPLASTSLLFRIKHDYTLVEHTGYYRMLTDICLYYATIQVSDKLVFQESKDIILNYIIECKGKASKNNVRVFMEESKDPLGIVRIKIPEEFRTSNVTTLGIIKELEDDDRIKVLKGKRHGQSHLLIFNYESEFKKIDVIGDRN